MEIGLTVLLFLCMTALLYVVLSLKITRQVDLQIKEFYKTRVHQDMQEFYREMEGYAALFENRIQRFRLLVERNEAAVRDFDSAEATGPVVAEPPPVATPAPVKTGKKKEPVKAVKALKGKPAKAAAQKKMAAKPAPQPRHQVKPVAAPVRPVEPAPMPRVNTVEDDAIIAEELIKDLFLKEKTEARQQSPKVKATPAGKAEQMASAVAELTQSDGSQVVSFFSKLGKAIEPVIFGEKPAASQQASAPASSGFREEQPPVARKPGTSLSTDFSEVLRRAEQIKAEKKAERERAEIEARAEFYAGGDSFEAVKNPAPVTAPTPVPAAPIARVAPAVESPAPRRNTLAVKELDRHTVNFLIDSLVKDNGYRRQALRALTENNIPLDEIARLSKIDIGELELMRQLGRF